MSNKSLYKAVGSFEAKFSFAGFETSWHNYCFFFQYTEQATQRSGQHPFHQEITVLTRHSHTDSGEKKYQK